MRGPSFFSASMRLLIQSTKRFLRAPRTIVAELLLVAAIGVASTVIPQGSDPASLRRLAVEHPSWARVVRALGWDHILASAWFVAVLVIAGGSLSIVLVEQWGNLRRQWGERLSERSFRSAPFKREILRPASPGLPPRAEFRSGLRLGLVGSPLFHLGLMIVIAGGVVRALWLSDTVVELITGETIPPRPAVVGKPGPGLLAGEVSLPEAVRFDSLEPSRYASGALEQVVARLTVGDPGRSVDLAINSPLEIGGASIHLGSMHGPAALVEVVLGEQAERVAIQLREGERGRYEGRWTDYRTGTDVRVWDPGSAKAELAEKVEVRVLRRGGLLFVGALSPAQGVTLSGGDRVVLHGLRRWAVFRVSRDPSRWIAYMGMLLAAIGAALMFTIVRVDTAVVVTREEGTERVFVALRAQKFAPLFSDRFEALVRSVTKERA